MKVTAWSIIFIIVVFSFSFMSRTNIFNKMEIIKQEIKYNNAIDEATMDATIRLMQQVKSYFNTQADSKYAYNLTSYWVLSSCDKFFETFSTSLGYYGGEKKKTSMKQYIPVIAAVGYKCMYIYSLDFVHDNEDENVLYLEHTLKPRIPYVIEDKTTITNPYDGSVHKAKNTYVNFTLDNVVYITELNADGSVKEKYDGQVIDLRHYNDIYKDQDVPLVQKYYQTETLLDGTPVEFTVTVSLSGIYEKMAVYKNQTIYYKKYFYENRSRLRYLYEEWRINDILVNKRATNYSIENYRFTEKLAKINTVYQQPGNYLTQGNPENNGMKDPFTGIYSVGEFNRVRSNTITSIVSDKIESYILRHNKFVAANNLSYTFLLPDVDGKEWARAIDNISIFAFVQGLDMLGKSYYNHYGLSGSKFSTEEKFFGLPLDRKNVTYNTPNDAEFPTYYSSYEVGSDNIYLLQYNGAVSFDSAVDAAKSGYYPDIKYTNDEESIIPVLEIIKDNLTKVFVEVKEIPPSEGEENYKEKYGYAKYGYTVTGKNDSGEDIISNIVLAAKYYMNGSGSSDPNYILSHGTNVNKFAKYATYNARTGKGTFIITENGDSYKFAVKLGTGTTGITEYPFVVSGIQDRTMVMSTPEIIYIPADNIYVVNIYSESTVKFSNVVCNDPNALFDWRCSTKVNENDSSKQVATFQCGFMAPTDNDVTYVLTFFNEFGKFATPVEITLRAVPE